MRNITHEDQFLTTPSQEYYYALGGQLLRSTVEFPQLSVFKTISDHNVVPRSPTPSDAFERAERATEVLELRYKGIAPFDGASRQIEYLCDQHYGLVRIDGKNAYFLDLVTQTAICGLAEPSCRLALEVLLGPVSVVFYGMKNHYCLHAGCVETSKGAIALIAESGVGKSTLSETTDLDWQQISDDVIVVDAESLLISGAFPQLKLANAQSDYFANPAASENPKIRAIFRLSSEPTEQIVITPLMQRDALLQIVRHSVGAKLFNAIELERHTLFCAQLAHRVPMWQVSYPRELTLLPTPPSNQRYGYN